MTKIRNLFLGWEELAMTSCCACTALYSKTCFLLPRGSTALTLTSGCQPELAVLSAVQGHGRDARASWADNHQSKIINQKSKITHSSATPPAANSAKPHQYCSSQSPKPKGKCRAEKPKME